MVARVVIVGDAEGVGVGDGVGDSEGSCGGIW